jgi:hypothetical protein
MRFLEYRVSEAQEQEIRALALTIDLASRRRRSSRFVLGLLPFPRKVQSERKKKKKQQNKFTGNDSHLH